MKKYTFSTITYKQIKSLVDIQKKVDDSQFEEWFSFSYPVNNDEIQYLKALIKKNRLRLNAYTEEELKTKFLAPIMNEVDFNIGDKITDWYERTISAIINNTELGGNVDYLVAKGEKEPEIPYFFIQEFKPSFSGRSPEDQLLAELLVAMQINEVEKMRGAYIYGSTWNFMILKKLSEGDFIFYVSKNFDALKISDLKKIYANLQAIKWELSEIERYSG